MLADSDFNLPRDLHGVLWRKMEAVHHLGSVAMLDLLPSAGNVGAELVGRDSIGKTKALDLYASAWGGCYGQEGSIARDWNSTPFSIEAMIVSLDHAAVGLNEGSHGSVAGAAGMEVLGRTIFALGDGSAKSRNGKQAQGPQTGAAQHCQRIPRGSPTTKQGEGSEGVCGAPNHRPEGFGDSATAIDDLALRLSESHGWAIDFFLKKLVAARMADESALKAEIDGHFRQFVAAAKRLSTDASAVRGAKKFAAIYAATKMASKWGALPLKQLREPLFECFRAWLASQRVATTEQRQNPLERLQQYVIRHPDIIDIDRTGYRSMTDDEVAAASGFFKAFKGQQCLMLRQAAWSRVFGSGGSAAIKQLKVSGNLVARTHNQLRAKVRDNSPKELFYAVTFERNSAP